MENRQDVQALVEITKRVSLRHTHPNMYRVLMVTAIACILLATNLYLTTPTFKPYGISKTIIASVFLFLGVSKIIFLNLYHNFRLVRLMAAASVAFLMFWGLANSQQSFAGKASFQLPTLYIALAVLEFIFGLLEPASNPLTGNGNGKQK